MIVSVRIRRGTSGTDQGHSQVANSGYSGGFVAVTVAPDRKSVVVNWQLTATSANVKMRSAGIYGPARKDQVLTFACLAFRLVHSLPCVDRSPARDLCRRNR